MTPVFCYQLAQRIFEAHSSTVGRHSNQSERKGQMLDVNGGNKEVSSARLIAPKHCLGNLIFGWEECHLKPLMSVLKIRNERTVTYYGSSARLLGETFPLCYHLGHFDDLTQSHLR